VLQDYRAPPLALYAIFPPTRHLSVKVRLFIEFLIERFELGRSLAAYKVGRMTNPDERPGPSHAEGHASPWIAFRYRAFTVVWTATVVAYAHTISRNDMRRARAVLRLPLNVRIRRNREPA
jgi:hypothetical protein